MNDEWQFYNYAVGFLDLLGQRDAYSNEGLLPTSDDASQQEAFREKVKKTVGAIDDLQRASRQFAEAAANQQESSLVKQMPEQLRGQFEEASKYRLWEQHWSDGIMYFTSLGYPDIKVPMKSVFHQLVTLGSMCFLGLGKKFPIRGGLEVAWGVELRPGELYGCAVAKAYQLESEVAQYPRIVLGPYMSNYLRQAAKEQPKTPFDEINQALAELSIQLLTEDMDGRLIVHYLGDEFRRSIAGSTYRFLYDKALEFINEQLDLHRSQQNMKLVLRYHHLLEYFNEHPPPEDKPDTGAARTDDPPDKSR